MLKSSDSSVSGPPVTSSSTRLTSSWRHGLTQWLQRSRASSAAAATNNNVVGSGGGGGGSNPRRGSGGSGKRASAANSSGGPGAAGAVSSAPISISIVSNHGHVRTLAPNSVGRVTTTAAAETLPGDAADSDAKTLSAIAATNTDQCSKSLQYCLYRCPALMGLYPPWQPVSVPSRCYCCCFVTHTQPV